MNFKTSPRHRWARTLLPLAGAALALAVVSAPCPASASPDPGFTLEPWAVAGGGGTSAGGGYELTGTAGQAATGESSGGDAAIAGGFWNALPLDAAGDGPRLAISAGPGGVLIVSWPFPSAGFRLQWTDAISSPASATAWHDWSGAAPALNGSNWRLSLAPSGSGLFLRLIRP